MLYREPQTGATMEVGAGEVVRRRVLEQAGWVHVPDVPDVTPPTPAMPCDPLNAIPYVSDEVARALNAAGFWTYEALQRASDAELLAISGIGAGRLRSIRKFLQER